MSDHNDDGATKSGGGGGGGVFTTMPSSKTNPGSALLLTYLTSKDNDPTPPRCIIEIDASGKETIHTIPKLKRIRCMGCISGAVYLAGYEKEIDVLDLKTGKFTTTIGGGWRHSQVMTTMNNKAYIACGKMFGGHGSGNLCEMDPQTKTYRYFTQRQGWHNAVAITASDDDEKIYAICGRLGGCTGRGGLWEIDMRTPPCKWEKHVGQKIVGHQFSPGGRKIFKTLQEAQTACLWHPSRDARGVTRDGNGNFTVWKGSSLVDGSSGDTSWVMKKMKKPEKPDEEAYPVECGYGNWTCIGQNGTWRHGTAMTYLNGTLFIVSGRRAGTNGTGAIWSVDPKTGKYNRLTSGDGFAMATTLSALRGHLYATCEGKLLKIDPSSGAVTQVGKRNWETTQCVANRGNTSLLYFLDASNPLLEEGKGIPILGKEKLLACRGKQLLCEALKMIEAEKDAKLPRGWAPMGPTEKLKLVPLKTDDDMYRRITQRVQQTMPKAKVLSITRIQNKPLWEKYVHKMHTMTVENDGKIGERWLFHGTRNTEPRLLYQSNNAGGFDPRLGRGYYGVGAYFAEKAVYSHTYSHPHPHSLHRRHKFFLGRVLTGYFKDYGTNKAFDLKRPPELPPGHANAPGLFDSVKAGPHDGSVMYIVYNGSQAYPQYLIEYEL